MTTYAKDALAKLTAASKRDRGINTSDGVRDLANAMFTVCKCSDEFPTDKELIDTLALLSGMACASLIDYAKVLEKEGQ